MQNLRQHCNSKIYVAVQHRLSQKQLAINYLCYLSPIFHYPVNLHRLQHLKNKQVMNMMIQLKMLSCCPCLPGLGLPMIKTCLQSPILLFAIRETDGNDDDDAGGGFHLCHERRDHVTNLV